MESTLVKYKEMGDLIASQGQTFVIALVILVVGLIVIKQVSKLLRLMLERLNLKPQTISTVSTIISIILLVIVVATALEHLGMNTLVIRRVIFLVSLAVIGIIAIFRPLLPTLPFKVGNTVKVGDLLGKIEATTLLNTRMRTFDGRTVFIPNSKILNDYVINYHFTGTRRVKVDVGIGYDQDILKAKQILETIMIEDPRVKVTPRPTVYVLNMANSCVQLGGRCWVNNVKYWTSRCELIEKTKLRFDHEGITIAFPQLDVHHYHGDVSPEFPGEEDHIRKIEAK
ncbi:MAG: mechanosensitive ion channel family protein [Thermodesulfobacteriota bacterium]|nr:mechanosensitive ion channel family protein [Thermodesulfobacteriota bacterium]